jgi:hypothetical protein
MAFREYHGIIQNLWDNPLFRSGDGVDPGQWQDPWYPSQVPGAGRIEPSQQGEWRSESDRALQGTSGWARWAVKVVDPFDTAPVHDEWIQVNWDVPFVGTPSRTWGTSRNDPDSTDAFATVDTHPPTLEIVPTKVNNNDIPNTGFAQQTLYFAGLPLSWLVHFIPSVSELDVNFIVRRRDGTQRSSLTFPTGLPTREQMGMEAFHNRMQSAVALGFLGGFPNFYEKTVGRDHLGGTILVRPAAGEFRDVPRSALGNVPLSSFTDRIRAVNSWAVAQVSRDATGITIQGHPLHEHPFAGAFPTFFHADYGEGIVCGTIVLTSDAAESREIPASQLGNVSADNFEARFRATQDYAATNGFVGGFPTFIDRRGLVGGTVAHAVSATGGGGTHSEMLYGTVLLKQDHSRIALNGTNHTDTFAAKRDLLLFRDPA